MTSRTLIATGFFALLLGSSYAIWCDAAMRRTIREREQQLVERRRELLPFAAISAELAQYESDKDWLQKQIDVINQLIQQRTTWAVPLLTAERIESHGIELDRVKVSNELELTTRSPQDAAAAVEMARRLRFVVGSGFVASPTSVTADGARVRMRFATAGSSDDAH